MKTKIILGLGLCLLLTVINLHRAMDNYGITDAKFKVDVLAESSSSSSSGVENHLVTIEELCWYDGDLGDDNECDVYLMFGTQTVILDLFGWYHETTGEYHTNCLYGGNGDGCSWTDCRAFGGEYDFYKITDYYSCLDPWIVH